MSSTTRLLLTNDDGIDAPGLAALEGAAGGLGRVLVVAPSGPQSGCGHRVTTHAPIAATRRDEARFAIDGTPADCVRLALHHLTGPVDWVISGINAGGNLGVDIFHSGTVAAVREGVIHGLRGVAISHYIARGRAIDWERAARWTARVLATLLQRPTPPETFWNVNLPHPGPEADEPGMVDCPLDPSPLPLDYRVNDGAAEYTGNYQARPRCPGGDVDVCFGGQIAVSLVPLMSSVDWRS